MTVYLGIDYGEKHFGVAIADGPLARPLATLDCIPDLALARIAKLAGDNGAEAVVIGLPEGRMSEPIQAFGRRLEKISGLPVRYHEETLSTQEAIAGLRAGKAKAKKLALDHVYAACLILEDYLEIGVKQT